MNDNLRAALSYIERGWPVLALAPGSKLPYTAHGVKDATLDPQMAEAWFENPEVNVGIACGEPAGFFVVDVDPRNGGNEQFKTLLQEHSPGGLDMVTKYARTGGGGYHMFFKLPADFKVKNGAIAEGIDIKSTGGYIVAPPSLHESGNRYEWELSNPDDPVSAPQWLLDMLPRQREARIVDGGVPAYDPNDDRPGSVFNRTTPIADILEPHGWVRHDIGPDGEERWTRPGKDGGISATYGWEGLPIFYVFTSSTELEPETGYSKFALYAILNHDGDFSAAAKELAAIVGIRRSALSTPASEPVYTWEPAAAEDHFVSHYVDWCFGQTDAAREYHEAAALSLLSVATSKARGRLTTYPEGLPTNLYVLLTGTTTRSRKSTSQKLMKQVLNEFYPIAELPSRSTTEALIRELSTSSNLPTVWLPDEFGIKLSEIYQRDFLKGLEELMLTLYDCQDYKYVKMDETVTVKNPHLNVLAAATPESLAMAGPGAMVGGLLPRFAVVLPPALPPARTVTEYRDFEPQRKALVAQLRAVLAWSSANRVIEFEVDALRILADAEDSLHSGGAATARLATMVYKVAMLFAAGRLSNSVSEQDARSAAAVIRRWEAGSKRLQPFLRRKNAELEFESKAQFLLRTLENLGPGPHHRSEVARLLRVTKSQFDQLMAALLDWGYIAVEQNEEGTFLEAMG